MSYVQKTTIIPSASVELARNLSVSLAGSAAEGMYQTALSPSGEFPATHYASAGLIGSEFAEMLEDPDLVRVAVLNLQLEIPAADLDALLNEMTISDGDALTAIHVAGLQVCTQRQGEDYGLF